LYKSYFLNFHSFIHPFFHSFINSLFINSFIHPLGTLFCISQALVCDGIKNCPNGADEELQLCQKLTEPSTTTTTTTKLPANGVHLFNAAIKNSPQNAREIHFFPFPQTSSSTTTTSTTTTETTTTR
jgi:hypothetical protein